MRVDFWSGLTTFVVSLLLIFWVIPAYVGRGFGGSIAPNFMPLVGAWIMLAASAAVWLKALHGLVKAGESLFGGIEPGPVLRQLWPFAFVTVAILCISWIGLVYSGPFLIASLVLFLGERRPTVVLTAALVPPALIWVLATQLMHVGMV